MKRNATLAAIAAALIATAAQGAFTLDVAAPSTALPGGAFSVSVPAASDIRQVTAAIQTDAGTEITSNRAFLYSPSTGGPAWVATIGVPSTLPPGSYKVVTAVATSAGVTRTASALTIGPREFKHENISLDQSLSQLQTEDSAEKQAQANQLWRILTTFDGGAVYQTGPLIIPVSKYIVTSPYGERRIFVLTKGGDESSVHQGIDLAVPEGTQIDASGAGRVVFAGFWLMTGNTVVIEQLPGVYSLYFHMERMLVHEGQVVRQGEAIGLVGATGLATGPHLHWQVQVAGVAVDPMSLLSAGLVALPAVAAKDQGTAPEPVPAGQ